MPQGRNTLKAIMGTAVILLLSFHLGESSLQPAFPVLKGPYLGQHPPGSTPAVFAPGIVSTQDHDEYGCTFSPDGKEFYFSRRESPRKVYILYSKETAAGWTEPRLLFSSSEYNTVEPHYSPTGDTLYFQSTRPLQSSSSGKHSPYRFSLYYVKKENSGWTSPRSLNGALTFRPHGQMSAARSGDLYVCRNSRKIIRLKSVDRDYFEPEKLNAPIYEYTFVEVHPCIEPDEKYLIFCSGRKGGYGKSDLWVIFSGDNGVWSEPVNLGSRINSSESEGFPSLSPDSRFLFFERSQDIFWVSTDVIHSLKK